MKTKLFYFICFLGFVLGSAAYTQEIELGAIDDAEPGSEVLLPVNFTDLNGIGSISLFFTFDESTVGFVDVVNIIPEMGFIISNTLPDPERVVISWFDFTGGSGIDFPNGKAFDVKFNYIAGQSDLIFTSDCEVTNGDNEPINVTLTNGSISGASGSTTSIWNGTGNWSDEQYWSNGIPGSETNATIASGVLGVQSGATCKQLDINSGAELNIYPNYFLIITEGVLIDGILNILSDETGTGSFVPNGVVVVNGEFNVNRYLSGNGSSDHFVSSPTLNSTTAAVFNSLPVNSYYEPDQDWLALELSDTLVSGMGYKVSDCMNNVVVFSGEPFASAVNLNDLSYTTNSLTLPNGFNLVGNPYTTAITWNEGDWVKSNINSAIYIWNNGNYVSWNGFLGAINNGVIPSMQGFFVVANDSDASLTIPLNARIQNNQPFYKNENDISDMVSFRLLNSSGGDDWAFFRFNNLATNGFDQEYDAYKLMGHDNMPQLYGSGSDDVLLSINEFPKPDESKDTSYMLGYIVNEPGNYTLIRNEFTILGQPIYLVDNETNEVINLKTDSSYQFTSEAGTFDERFRLFFRYPLAVEEFIMDYVKIYTRSGKIYIQSDKPLIGGEMEIYNVMGQLINFEKLPNGVQEYQMDVTLPNDMLVVIRLNDSFTSISRKLLIKN